jgi:peroxiredoxin
LRSHQTEFERLDVRVLVITFERPEVAARYVEQTGMSWPLLVDQPRQLYQAYGMPSAGWRRLLGRWATWKKYLELVARGRPVRLPTNDIHQLGGDVLIDPDGRVRLHYVSADPADRPPIDVLLAAPRTRTPAPE